VSASIDDLLVAGRLVVRSGNVRAVVTESKSLRVDVGAQELRVGHVINCTGPSTDVAASSDPLLRSLLASGAVRPDPLALGLDVTDDGALVSGDGTPSDLLWTLGPLCRGRLWETTAVPEIRDQSCALATRLVGERRPAAV
jgi:uncharacterized NAD(P)/FAD-binding protein YdhS